MNSAPDVTIIIVSWNVRRCLEKCLRSIPAALGGLRGDVLVIDNASSDGSADAATALANEIPHLLVMRNAANVGFAKASNIGLKQGSGEYLLLLNPDTELHPNAIAQMVHCATANHTAAVGARHVNPDGTLQPSIRRLPTMPALALLLLKLHHLMPNVLALSNYFARDFNYQKTQPAEQPAGSCLLLSRPAVEQIGALDERYYNWFEEVDWCKRAKDAGLPVWYCAEAVVTHAGGQSFGQLTSVDRQRQFNQSLFSYIKKHHGILPWVLLLMLHPLSLLLAWLSQHFLPPRRRDANTVMPKPKS